MQNIEQKMLLRPSEQMGFTLLATYMAVALGVLIGAHIYDPVPGEIADNVPGMLLGGVIFGAITYANAGRPRL